MRGNIYVDEDLAELQRRVEARPQPWGFILARTVDLPAAEFHLYEDEDAFTLVCGTTAHTIILTYLTDTPSPLPALFMARN